jgi:hypothetical protein
LKVWYGKRAGSPENFVLISVSVCPVFHLFPFLKNRFLNVLGGYTEKFFHMPVFEGL